MVPLSYYLVLSGILFACGVTGFLIKRNIITIFMSIELMLNGVNLSFVAFAAHWHVARRTGIRFLRDGSSGSRSRSGTRDHHFRLPDARDVERGPGEFAEIMSASLNLWLIPTLPLAGAAINGFLGKKSSRKAVTRSACSFRARHSRGL